MFEFFHKHPLTVPEVIMTTSTILKINSFKGFSFLPWPGLHPSYNLFKELI